MLLHDRLPVTVLSGFLGAGKTTLFKMITGAEQPDAGTLRLGETVDRRHERHRPGRQHDLARSVFVSAARHDGLLRPALDSVAVVLVGFQARPFLALLAVAAQAQWVLRAGSSNWFDHILHVLVVPVALFTLLGRLW